MSTRFEKPGQPQKRVVVTGMGAVTPLGLTMEQTWNGLVQGKSGISRITKFDASAFGTQIAGEVRGFNPDLYIEKKEQKKMDAFIHYAVAASKMALQDSGLILTDEIRERTGCIIGAGMGGLETIEEQFKKYLDKGHSRMSPFFIPGVIVNLAAGQVSIDLELKGVNYSVTSACASGSHSLGEAFRYIQRGQCDVMFAGGTESTVCVLGIGGFEAMRALSSRNDEPERASRPWDKARDGFVMGEGAGVLVLESYEHAVKRGARILCEIVGYGVSSDGYHMTSPSPGGSGAAKSMIDCLRDAEVSPEQVNYMNAHGTSTPVGDKIEVEAIKKVFKDHAKKVWVSSTKSMTGHLLGAAGAVESAICVMSLVKQLAPPTINLENPDEGCDLDFIPDKAREGRIDYALNNSFGFGGTNASLLFARIK